MDSPASRARAARTILFTGVGANLFAAGALVALFHGVTGGACAVSFSPLCVVPAGLDAWLVGVLVVCGTFPLLSVVGPRLALLGVLSQDLLLFLSVWMFLIWGLLPGAFSLFGGLMGVLGCGLLYRRGIPGPPLPTMLLGVSWSGLVALGMVYLVSTPVPPVYFPAQCATLGPLGSSCAMTFGSTLAVTEWAVPALILTTAVALVPIPRARWWLGGLAGSVGILVLGVVLFPYFAVFTVFTIVAGLSLAIGGWGYAQFAKTGRSLGQILDGVPPPNRLGRAGRPASPDATRTAR